MALPNLDYFETAASVQPRAGSPLPNALATANANAYLGAHTNNNTLGFSAGAPTLTGDPALAPKRVEGVSTPLTGLSKYSNETPVVDAGGLTRQPGSVTAKPGTPGANTVTVPGAGTDLSKAGTGPTAQGLGKEPPAPEVVKTPQQLQDAVDIATANYNADPSPANRTALQAAQAAKQAPLDKEKATAKELFPNLVDSAFDVTLKDLLNLPGNLASKVAAQTTFSIQYTASGQPVFIRTFQGKSQPVSRRIYETEGLGPNSPNRPPPVVNVDTNADYTSKINALNLPEEFKGLTADQIRPLATGPEYLALLDAQDALTATGHKASEFAGLTDDQIFQKPGGVAFLKARAAKAAYDKAVYFRAHPEQDPKNAPANPTAGVEGQGAPQADTALIDQLSAGVDSIQAGELGIHTDEQLAQRQLAQATDLNQRHALGDARSGTGFNSGVQLGQGVATQGAIQRQGTFDQSELRAQQEQERRGLALDVFNAAGDLGLQQGALDIDVNQMNMAAVSQYLSNIFSDQNTKMDITEQQAQAVSNFTRDMALVELSLAKTDQATQEAFFDRELTKYGIDKDSALAAALRKQQNKDKWLNFGTQLLQTGLTIGAAAAFSDRRVKTDINNTDQEDLEELLKAVKSQTFNYKDPKYGSGHNMGVMAQDLDSTKLGKAMVSKSPEGPMQVDTGKAALAALSGLALVYDKLAKLEASLKNG